MVGHVKSFTFTAMSNFFLLPASMCAYGFVCILLGAKQSSVDSQFHFSIRHILEIAVVTVEAFVCAFFVCLHVFDSLECIFVLQIYFFV